MIKGIIFDFNGTLFFDTDKHEKAWGAYAEKLLNRPLTKDEFDNLMGRNNTLILKFLLGRMPSEDEERTMGGEKEEVYRNLCRSDGNGCKLAPGAEEFLNVLTERNIPIAIATSSNLENVEFYREMFHIEKWFSEDRIVYDDGSINGKPAPDIYLKAAERLGLKPAECAVYEDAVSGIAAARNAEVGMITAVASATSAEVLAKENEVSRVITDYKNEKDMLNLIV